MANALDCPFLARGLALSGQRDLQSAAGRPGL
jgi:hypothetical protein